MTGAYHAPRHSPGASFVSPFLSFLFRVMLMHYTATKRKAPAQPAAGRVVSRRTETRMHEMGLGKPRTTLAEEESQNEEEESGSDDIEVVVTPKKKKATFHP